MSTSDASTGLIYNVYGVYELAEAKDRAGNAFRGSEHGSGTSPGVPGPLCQQRALSLTWPAYGLKLSLRSVVGTSTARRSRAGRKWNVYDIPELAEEKNRAGKAFCGPERGLGTWTVAPVSRER